MFSRKFEERSTGKIIHGEYGEYKNVCIGNIVLEGKLTIPTWSGGIAKY